MACLSALEILSTLSCCRLLVQNNSSLTLSRYICKLFPVRILASARARAFVSQTLLHFFPLVVQCTFLPCDPTFLSWGYFGTSVGHLSHLRGGQFQ